MAEIIVDMAVVRATAAAASGTERNIPEALVAEDDSSKSEAPPVSIWDDPNVRKFISSSKKCKQWSCRCCNKTFNGWNATKVVAHLSKTYGRDIAICQGKIGNEQAEFYASLQTEANKKRKRNSSAKDSVARLIDVQQSVTTAAIASSSSQNKKSRRVLTENDTGSVSTLATAVTARESSVSTRIPSNTRMMQLTLDVQQPNSSNELALTVAIADMIHSCGLPFNLADEPKLAKIIKLARCVRSTYKPPTRQDVACRLLKFNYKQLQERQCEQLKTDANIYGLTLYGDGATVKRMPLLNILASGAHLTTAVLEITDCSGECCCIWFAIVALLFFVHSPCCFVPQDI